MTPGNADDGRKRAAKVVDGRQGYAIREASLLIRSGGLVAFPTETVYGLGANAFDAKAVASIFEVKRRPRFDPLIVHVHDTSKAAGLVTSFDKRADALADAFWPGPLTLVLPKDPAVPDIVTAGLESVAVRVPRHPVAEALMRAAGVPIAAPSANPFGYVSPTTASHVADQLGGVIPFILDGGPCQVGLESTVVSLLGPSPLLLRPGAVSVEEMEPIIGPISRADHEEGRSISPGRSARHYSPRTRITLFAAGEAARITPAKRAGLLTLRPSAPDPRFVLTASLSETGDLVEAASHLFERLRAIDQQAIDVLYVETVPEAGIGLAIMDRLTRAAADHE